MNHIPQKKSWHLFSFVINTNNWVKNLWYFLSFSLTCDEVWLLLNGDLPLLFYFICDFGRFLQKISVPTRLSEKRRGRSRTQATALEGESSQFRANPAPFKLTCLWMISSRKSGERLRQSLWPSRTLLFVVFSWSMTLWGGRRLGPLERKISSTRIHEIAPSNVSIPRALTGLKPTFIEREGRGLSNLPT